MCYDNMYGPGRSFFRNDGARGRSRRSGLSGPAGTSVSNWLSAAAAQRLRTELLGAAWTSGKPRTVLSESGTERCGSCAEHDPTGGGVTAVLDAGALIAIDKRDRKVGAMLRVLQRDAEPVRTSAGAIAQVWRAGRRQANLGRTLPGLDVAALDEVAAKKVGELLGSSGTSDLVDAHVALLVPPRGHALTSDEPDIKALLRTRRVKATVIAV